MTLGFEISCPNCGADLAFVTAGKVIAGRETSAIMRCTECVARAAEWQVWVRLVPVFSKTQFNRQRPSAICGTDSGYYAHLRRGRDTPCDECKAAHSAAARASAARRRRVIV